MPWDSWPDVKGENGQAPEARRADWIRVLGNVACSSSHTPPTSLLSSSSTMTKPSLIQSILGRPSQTYHFPSSKDYHSTKNDLLRAAGEAPSASESRPQSYFTAADSESGYYSSASSASRYSEARSHSEASSRRSSRLSGEPETAEGSLRPAKSQRPKSQGTPLTQSTASSHSNTDDRSDAVFTRSSPYTPPTSFSSNTTPRQSPLPSLVNQPSYFSDLKTSSSAARDGDAEVTSSDGESTDGDDVFYTPRSSLYGSPRTSRTSGGMLIDPKAVAYALLPVTSSPTKSRSSVSSDSSLDALTPHPSEIHDISPASRTSSESSLTSTTSTSSADGTIASSATSRATNTTQITTPMASEHGSSRQNDVKTVTIARSHHARSQTVPTFIPQPTARGQPRPLAATRKRSQTEIRRQTYTDEDWAKEVRWLAPVIAAKQESPQKNSRVLSGESNGSKIPSSHPVHTPPTSSLRIPPPAKSYPPLSPSAEHRKRHTRRSRGSRSSRGRMSALLEEDESEYSDVTPGSSSVELSRAPSPVPEEAPLTSDVTPQNAAEAIIARSRSHRSAKESSSDDASENPDARVQAYARSQGHTRKSYSHTRRLSRSIEPSVFTFSQTLPTHSIPTPMPEVSPSTKSGLTLPHAAYSGDSKAMTGDGKIDLVRAGIAQTSMATVEVTRGVAQQESMSGPKKKRRAFSFQLPFRKSKGKGKESMTPAHLLDSLPIPVAYLQHLAPPSFVPASYVLVQVFAVGLDPLDSLLVQEKTVNGAKGAGFIPGRSIVGKAVEVGWDVKADVCRRGDWVVGLLDVKKSGALAEFVIIERHRVHRAPQPLSRPGTFFPPTRRSHVRSKSLPSQLNRHPFAQLHQDLLAPMTMTIEELALLPICGLPAHRAIRTFVDVISPAKPKPDSPELAKPARVLVLQGHDGPGSLAVQMLSRRGVKVYAQVPDSVARNDASSGDDEDTDGPGPSAPTRVKQTRFDRLEARLSAWGAEAIYVGEPLEVLERLVEDGRSFDAILDTIGGADIWEAGRKVLLMDPEQDTALQNASNSPSNAPTSSSGTTKASSSSNKRSFALTQFTTLVGDNPTRPIPSAQDHLRSGFRSLKRTMSTGSRSRSSSPTKSSANSLRSPSKDSLGPLMRRSASTKVKTQKRTISYAWVSVAADLDFEGEDVRDSLGAIVNMVEEGSVRPWVGEDPDDSGPRVVPFDKAPELFRRDGDGPVGPLKDGGTCVVRIIP